MFSPKASSSLPLSTEQRDFEASVELLDLPARLPLMNAAEESMPDSENISAGMTTISLVSLINSLTRVLTGG